ncbi:MAG: efflux RND transporter periplasmic adaptor subunit [Taibaiella sp.]|nr:efflux RND transporter periplasmic adaptor subunit [Taibaiella sp.]
MKHLIYLLFPAIIFASCGAGNGNKAEELAKLKKERSEIDGKIKALEAAGAGGKEAVKATLVSVMEVQPTEFNGNIEVQSTINGDENILSTPQAPGTVKTVLVRVGQRVNKGQVMATLDAGPIERQIEALSPQLGLTKSLYEKQQGLWSQNIGTEVQLLGAKTNYESVQKQISALKSQRDMYRVVSPISGTVDAVSLKEGEVAQPGMSGVRVVSYDKLKAEAMLGENYLGKVKEGDPVILALPNIGDSIKATISYVAKSVDPASRSFQVMVRLNNNSKLHPNMSCIMKIANYTNKTALAVPVSLIQKTSDGSMIYIAEGNAAKAVTVTTGRNSNGMVEIVTGLNPGDKVITAGFEEMENGQKIAIQ